MLATLRIYLRISAKNITAAAPEHPEVLEVLQFYGFPIELPVVQDIMKSGNAKSLEVVLRDLHTRNLCQRHEEELIESARSRPQMVEYFFKFGVIYDEYTHRPTLAKLYKDITGKDLPEEK